ATGLMSIFLICPHIGHPRYHKRERSLRSLCAPRVAAFVRPHYRDNAFDNGACVLKLGEVEQSRYLSRIPRLLGAVARIRTAKTPSDVMYAFGADSYLLGRLAGLGRGILEIGDLRAIDTKNPLLHAVERLVVQDCRALVVTSPAFVDAYYRPHLPKGRSAYVIENKLDATFRGKRQEPDMQARDIVRIGVIGMLRYRRPLELLVRAVQSIPWLQLICYGDGPDRQVVEASLGERVRYFGPFRNPQDLQQIYRSIDVNFVVYDSASKNVQLALPNKYYESIFFGVPILAAKGTELERRVVSKGIGGALDISSFEAFID